MIKGFVVFNDTISVFLECMWYCSSNMGKKSTRLALWVGTGKRPRQIVPHSAHGMCMDFPKTPNNFALPKGINQKFLPSGWCKRVNQLRRACRSKLPTSVSPRLSNDIHRLRYWDQFSGPRGNENEIVTQNKFQNTEDSHMWYYRHLVILVVGILISVGFR